MIRYRALSLVALACVWPIAVNAQDSDKQQTPPPKQEAPAKPRTLTFDDYKEWERISQAVISNDGKYLLYGVVKADADGYVVARKIDGPEKALIPDGIRPAISDTSKWAAYLITLPKAEIEKNTEQKKPSPTKLGIRSLENGEEHVIDDVANFSFLKDKDLIVALRPKMAPGPGAGDLLLINATNGEQMVISNVKSYSLNEPETLMAIQIDSGTGYQAFEVLDIKTGIMHPIYSGKDDVTSFAWAKDADVLSLSIALPDDKKEGDNNDVLRVSGFDGVLTRQRFNPTAFANFPKGMKISDGMRISPSDDGSKIALTIQPWNDKEKPVKPKDKAGVEVWNTKDTRPMPLQKRQSARDRARGILFIWDPDANTLTKASPGKDDEIPGFDVQTYLSQDMTYAIVQDGTPYTSSVTNGINYADFWVTNLKTGEKTEAVKKNQFGLVPSVTGNYFAYYDNKLWWVYDVRNKKARALHPDGYANFEDELDDHTVAVKPPEDQPTWLDKDAGLIVQDQYDAWLCDPETGKMVKLTDGRKDKVRYRYQEVTPYDDEPKREFPMYFDVFDTETKKDGVYIVGKDLKGTNPIFDDVQIRRLVKAKDADRMMFSMESYLKSPDLYITNQAFSAAKPVTHTNPQQAQFKWGKSELVNYKSRFGVDLQGTLIYPADYDPSKKYPMVTYIYERLSDNKNQYQFPSEWSAYNLQYFSQNGYFVFEPDIAYKGNRPGESAVDCLEPAVDAVVKKNVGVDPKKVGLIGHSWGAYQTAFVTTVSDRFAVGACGAPLTELTSMYNSYYWNGGMTDQVIFESSQGRMRVPFWEDPKPYFDNSPVWQSAKRKVPLLMAFGDADGAVDWHQGQYLYNTLRRMGKQCVMLVYAGENHGLAQRPNQLDYARRLREWLDVYLKGAKPEKWITDGVPYIQQVPTETRGGG
ncbi:MAG: S9 family peptidase [Armatimonadetes bacterium]|nr:S9 family peptidase [Armatimonadota bacterium]